MANDHRRWYCDSNDRFFSSETCATEEKERMRAELWLREILKERRTLIRPDGM
jgi:hypothetical protein